MYNKENYMMEIETIILDEHRKLAKVVFVVIACGCVGIFVYGIFFSQHEGIKNWRNIKETQDHVRQESAQRRGADSVLPTTPSQAALNHQTPPMQKKEEKLPPPSNTDTELMRSADIQTIVRILGYEMQNYAVKNGTYQGYIADLSHRAPLCLSTETRISTKGDLAAIFVTDECQTGTVRYWCTDSTHPASAVEQSIVDVESSAGLIGTCVYTVPKETSVTGQTGGSVEVTPSVPPVITPAQIPQQSRVQP